MTIHKPLVMSAGRFRRIPASEYLDPDTLGSGTASGSKILYGDNTWQVPSAAAPLLGGPLVPDSCVPATPDRIFPTIYDSGASTGTRYEDMISVEASLGADSKWELYWDLPSVLPTGTLKLQLWARANATSGNAKVNAKWASVTVGEDPGVTTVAAEGTSTLSWGAGDAHEYKELLVTLDGDTAVALQRLIMSLVFETSSWTLAVASGWRPRLIWTA